MANYLNININTRTPTNYNINKLVAEAKLKNKGLNIKVDPEAIANNINLCSNNNTTTTPEAIDDVQIDEKDDNKGFFSSVTGIISIIISLLFLIAIGVGGFLWYTKLKNVPKITQNVFPTLLV